MADLVAIRRDIERAFAEVAYPGDDNIVRGSTETSTRIVQAFRGRNWRDLPVRELNASGELAEALDLMTPSAFRYFLPGFMLLGLGEVERDVGNVGNMAEAALQFRIDRSSGDLLSKSLPAYSRQIEENRKEAISGVLGLDTRQMIAVRGYLIVKREYIAELLGSSSAARTLLDPLNNSVRYLDQLIKWKQEMSGGA